MQKGSSTGKLPGENVNKVKGFFENLSSSDLKPAPHVINPESTNDKPDNDVTKSEQANNGVRKTPPKPPIPSKPIIAPKPAKFAANSDKYRSKSCDATPPSIAPKPTRSKSSVNCNLSEESELGNSQPEQHNGLESSHEDDNSQKVETGEEQNGYSNGILIVFSTIRLYQQAAKVLLTT